MPRGIQDRHAHEIADKSISKAQSMPYSTNFACTDCLLSLLLHEVLRSSCLLTYVLTYRLCLEGQERKGL